MRSDLLQSLLDELAGLGQPYRAVAIVPGLDAQAPSALGFDVRITNQDAILVRADLYPAKGRGLPTVKCWTMISVSGSADACLGMYRVVWIALSAALIAALF